MPVGVLSLIIFIWWFFLFRSKRGAWPSMTIREAWKSLLMYSSRPLDPQSRMKTILCTIIPQIPQILCQPLRRLPASLLLHLHQFRCPIPSSRWCHSPFNIHMAFLRYVPVLVSQSPLIKMSAVPPSFLGRMEWKNWSNTLHSLLRGMQPLLRHCLRPRKLWLKAISSLKPLNTLPTVNLLKWESQLALRYCWGRRLSGLRKQSPGACCRCYSLSFC